MSSARASILAIGTELTTGQITNRNAAWLSEKLVDLGVETVLHETVADDRAMIASGLDRCKAVSQLIFVTGGLGPTTDDFTRDVISEWTGMPLEFYEPSWKKIEERLTRFGIPVAASNRQQAYYPATAKVVANAQGTADAFTMSLPSGHLLVILPGPPREVEAVWESEIEARVRERFPDRVPLQLLSWQCIGKSEAELGEITERALAGSGLKTGYRAHRPYVEIKVWATAEDIRIKSAQLSALERALEPWVATRQGEDLAGKLLDHLARAEEIEIADAGSGGVLAERLGSALRSPSFQAQADAMILSTEWAVPSNPEAWVHEFLGDIDTQGIRLAMAGPGPSGAWAFGLREGPSIQVQASQSIYRGPELLDRSRRFAVEFALKQWCEWLAAMTQ